MNTATFKTNFNGGTRANRFLVSGIVGIPGNDATLKSHTFHVRATFIPPITNITLTAHAYGRKVNIPGDREYAPWQVTIYDDFSEEGDETSSTANAKNLWSLFSAWHRGINDHESNTPSGDVSNFPNLNYKTSWQIQHLGLNGNTLKTFKMNGCWPKTVGDIDFNMTRRNFLNTFSVVMLYDDVVVDSLGDVTP